MLIKYKPTLKPKVSTGFYFEDRMCPRAAGMQLDSRRDSVFDQLSSHLALQTDLIYLFQ